MSSAMKDAKSPTDPCRPCHLCKPFCATADSCLGRHRIRLRGRLERSARAVNLFGRLAVLETHTLRY